MEDDINKPYKICDVNREKKKGIVATSLEDLINKVPDKLGLPAEHLTVVLECDGTEVDDEEYFSTLDPDTSLMILHGNEKWAPNMPKCQVSLDQTDDVAFGDKAQVANLVGRLQHNLCHISLLGGQDLELLSDMDPDSLADIVTDRDNRIILEHIKEASGRILLEKRQAQDAMELLKLYHQSVSNGAEDVSPPSQERV
ncbi:DNA fragmentation factor subunit alpha-like [Pararge aegeria]|uniref:Jg20541 protein n=2 Tax=Pararge aegeria TaxID=116150 RepID=A0A8S4RZF5_9NEOP|nr:DNA fragmentation factor subunit alpha-like [Pararge aegeria]CAH2243241.1 jg20541 [Pararge aegeria aegeria]